MPSSTFKSSFSITHIGTATAIFEIDGIDFLIDPFFSPAGTTWDMGGGNVLKDTDTPALALENLPAIDVILLSHEDHPGNLDELGRRLLDGRHVFTTMDGANNLVPRLSCMAWSPGKPSLLHLVASNSKSPQLHVNICPVASDSMSTSARWRVHRLHHHFQGGWCYSEWLPNAIYSTGDTVYIDELAKIPEKFHVVCAVMSLGSAFADLPDGPLQITMDGKQAAHLFRTVKADYLVPMHYESWGHFTQFGKDLVKVFEEEGIMEKVRWLSPGTSVKVL